MVYKIEQRISTLIDNAVMNDGQMAAAFSIGTTKFSHWDFNYRDGWPSDLWLAEDSVEAPNLVDALNAFHKLLARVIPRISFIGQSYIDFLTEPYLVVKTGS